MTKADNAPTIGTPEAAVRACVTLIASVTGQPEELTERYLDLYYQTRRAAELEAARENFLRSWNAEGTLTVLAEDGPPRAESTDCHTSAAAQTSFECRAARQDVRNDENAEKETPVGIALGLIETEAEPLTVNTSAEIPKQKKVDFDEVLASASAGAKTPSKPKNAPYGKIKAEIRDRFIALRAQGMTLAQTVNLSGGKVTENQILNIMNGSKVGMDAYNAIEDAMNKWEKTVNAADKADSTTE